MTLKIIEDGDKGFRLHGDREELESMADAMETAATGLGIKLVRTETGVCFPDDGTALLVLAEVARLLGRKEILQ